MLDLIILILRAIQFLFAIIVLGLTAHVSSYDSPPSQSSFLLFTAIFTILALLYLALSPRFFPSLSHPLAHLALDALTMLFWFAGFVALAVFRHRAGGVLVGYWSGDAWRACGLVGNWCAVVEAAAVFGGLEWALFVATTVLTAHEFIRSRGRATGPVGGDGAKV